MQRMFCATTTQSQLYLEDSQVLQRIFKVFCIYSQIYAVVYEQVTVRTRQHVTLSPAEVSLGVTPALTIWCTALPCHAEVL